MKATYLKLRKVFNRKLRMFDLFDANKPEGFASLPPWQGKALAISRRLANKRSAVEKPKRQPVNHCSADKRERRRERDESMDMLSEKK